MDYKEIKNKSESELHRILAEYRDKLRDLRFKDASKQLKNVREIRKVKKIIARVLMLLNQKIKKIINSKQTTE
jgi:large subunit ribosomal protein L29